MYSVFRQVSTKERLPESSGYYTTNKGMLYFISSFEGWVGKNEPQWWLEEIDMPSENELNKFKPLGDDSEVNIYDTGFYDGVNYILNKLKGENR